MAVVQRLPPGLIQWIGRQQFRPVVGPVVHRASRRYARSPRTIPHGQLAGLRFDPAGTNAGYGMGTTEPLIQELLAREVRPQSTAWDVGANVGFFTVLLARLVGPRGRVVAFEPQAVNVAALARNCELNGFDHVRVVEAAIGETEGSGDLVQGSARTLAWLAGADVDPQRPRVPVTVTTLDAQLRLGGAPDLVKIDIEGGEVAALRGASRLLTEVRPVIVCEFHGTNRAVTDILEDARYSVQVIETPGLSPRDAEWSVHVLARPQPADRAGVRAGAADGLRPATRARG